MFIVTGCVLISDDFRSCQEWLGWVSEDNGIHEA